MPVDVQDLDADFFVFSAHKVYGPTGVGAVSYTHLTRGSITFNGKDLLAMSPEDRAHEGIFLSFQAPVEIPGLSLIHI